MKSYIPAVCFGKRHKMKIKVYSGKFPLNPNESLRACPSEFPKPIPSLRTAAARRHGGGTRLPATMSSSLALPLRPRRALPTPSLRLAPKHPSLRAHQCRLLVRTPKRALPATRRLLLAPRASLSATSPGEPAREGSAVARKAGGYRNRFLDLARLGAVAEGVAETFFRSEIRRRLAVTAVLIVLSRVGYFVPLPGFDRRLIPDSYLSFAPLPADDLVDFSSELKLSFFQLGISHQISASIVMQVLCHVLPSLEKIRKEGLDGHEKIKGYIWWLSLGFAIVAACTVSCYSLQYSIYAASYRVKHVVLTSFLLVLGAMSTTWICDTISESGFGHGSSLIICVGILTGYTDTLHKMLTQFSAGNMYKCWPYILGVAGIFMMVTMGAVLVTEGCRKIKLQYYGFKLASGARNENSPATEVEPYIPFNINPTGMQPLLTTSYLLAFPSIMASIFGSPFWGNLKEILNPRTSVGGSPWVYYLTYAFLVFVFNIFDIVGSIIELRRSYQAYNVMPALSKVLKRYGA
ncbi:hypothetical protein BRADI_2g26310v3 [Brachypodium distachyon]|uniref:Preprotein translocase subunit SCY2, chloroplastic n=1 Tax=Brachypodium distachyon TaxID=15368 RepID=A0A2K2DAM0_BRADI|nr:hypothetical protein BRADI_2g26310v3 [Brachypodium distachyon]PNT71323.1 hypothetical protein BRADI_2g26310v3 [Brachypodium distachyon]